MVQIILKLFRIRLRTNLYITELNLKKEHEEKQEQT